MARNKTDKYDTTPAATLAKTATWKGEVESQKPVGLLGGELDVFGIIGLGLGASPRAKELILKGLLFEFAEQEKVLTGKQKRSKGRPRKDFPKIDIERGAAVLGADDLWRDKTGKGLPTQKAAIELAQQIDRILCKNDSARKPLFGTMTEFKRVQDSVSKGLREIGLDAERFLKK
jgi:hypothetical protein